MGRCSSSAAFESGAVGGLPAALAPRRLGSAIDLRFQLRVGADPPKRGPTLFDARLFGPRRPVDGHVMCHVARLRAWTVPDPLSRVHPPIPALCPGAPGTGGGWGQDAVFPALRSLKGAFGDPAIGFHSVNGLACRKRVPPEPLSDKIGQGDHTVMTDIGGGGVDPLCDVPLLPERVVVPPVAGALRSPVGPGPGVRAPVAGPEFSSPGCQNAPRGYASVSTAASAPSSCRSAQIRVCARSATLASSKRSFRPKLCVLFHCSPSR